MKKTHAWWKDALTKWYSTSNLLKVKVKQNFLKLKKCKHNYVYNFLIGILNLNKYFCYQLSSPKQLFSQHFTLLGQVDILTNVQACFTRNKEWKKFCSGLSLNHTDCVVWTNTHSYQQVYKNTIWWKGALIKWSDTSILMQVKALQNFKKRNDLNSTMFIIYLVEILNFTNILVISYLYQTSHFVTILPS